MSSQAQATLIVVQPDAGSNKSFYKDLMYGLQITALVLGTYGLMVAMFALW